MAYPRRYRFLWFFYKAPLTAYRLGLGWFLRRSFRMLVLTTRGRKSGLPRHTMLEHAWFNGRAYIASGWGERNQWIQNIREFPLVTVQRGGMAYGAMAVRVTNDQELAALYGVTAGKSAVWKQYLESWGIHDDVIDYVAKKDRLIVLRLDPVPEVPLRGLRRDLVWLWAAFAAVLAIWTWLR